MVEAGGWEQRPGGQPLRAQRGGGKKRVQQKEVDWSQTVTNKGMAGVSPRGRKKDPEYG